MREVVPLAERRSPGGGEFEQIGAGAELQGATLVVASLIAGVASGDGRGAAVRTIWWIMK